MSTPFVSEKPVVTQPTTHKRNSGTLEMVCAVAAIVLAIIGLAGGARFFDAIATIVVGATFIFETWTVLGAARGKEHERGIWAERTAGWVGVVLGILALLRLAPTFLAPISLIVFGFGLSTGMGMASRSGRVLVGLAAIVLGVLGLLRLDPRTLTLIGLIGVSAMLLLSGPAAAWREHRGVHAPAA